MGRARKPVYVLESRPLTPEDLLKLESERGIKPKPLQKLRSTHHALARLLASGMMSDTEVAIICGTTSSRISVLKADPAFQELLTFYRQAIQDKRDIAEADFQTHAAALSVEAIEEMRDRLADDPKDISIDELALMTKVAADRSGNGPASKTTTNVNFNVNLADRLRLARQRADSGMEPVTLSPSHPKVIDHE